VRIGKQFLVVSQESLIMFTHLQISHLPEVDRAALVTSCSARRHTVICKIYISLSCIFTSEDPSVAFSYQPTPRVNMFRTIFCNLITAAQRAHVHTRPAGRPRWKVKGQSTQWGLSNMATEGE